MRIVNKTTETFVDLLKNKNVWNLKKMKRSNMRKGSRRRRRRRKRKRRRKIRRSRRVGITKPSKMALSRR